MMYPELKAKWVEALRSGTYMQGREKLYNANDDTFCCLGVLCRVEGTEIEEVRLGETLGFDYLHDVSLSGEEASHLIEMNDGDFVEGKTPQSFTEIAAWIEANL